MQETIAENQLAQKQAIELKKEKIVRGITCPACAGELDLTEGVETFNCKYCGSLLTTEGDKGTLKYYVPRTISREEAINRTYRWLDKGLSKARGLEKKSKVEDVFLTYIPYWRIKAVVVGWIFGQEARTRRVGNTTQTYYVDVEKKIQMPFDQTFAACDISELGVQQVNLSGNELIPVEFEQLQKDGMTFNIISSKKEISETARNQFVLKAKSANRVAYTNFEYLEMVREYISIVYYPLWVIRYNFQNRIYQVVVDGEDGSICYGKAPGNNLFRAIVGIFGISLGMYFATFFAAFALGDGDASFGAYILVLIIGIVLISWGYKKFRYGSEIEEGTGIVKQSKQKNDTLQKYTGIDTSNMDANSLLKGIGVASIAGGVLSSVLRNVKR